MRAPDARRLVVVPAAVVAAFVATVPAPVHAFDPGSPAALYEMACASCHGLDGSGIPPDSDHYRSLTSPPADLTDPLFNSREPRADWFLVVKYGGGSIGLSQQMPAYGDALTDEQIESLIDHIKTLADTSAYPPGDLNFLRAIETIKAFPEDELLVLTRVQVNPEPPDQIRNVLYLGRRFLARAQWEVKLAHVIQDPRAELDELELGVKYALADDLARQFLLAGGLEVALPVGSDRRSEEIIPYFSVAQGLGDRLTFQGTARSHLPTESVKQGDVKLSGAVHWMTTAWPRGIFPALEGTVTFPFESGSDITGTLIPQVYVGLSRLGHVALALGGEVPLADDSYDYRMRAFLLWDMADGMFWQGW